MEVIDVVIDEALNDKEIKRLLTQAKFKSNTHVTYNNNANINNNDDIANLSISSSPQSSSPLVLPQYSNSEPLDLLEKKTKKTKSHINRSRRHNDDYGDEDNDYDGYEDDGYDDDHRQHIPYLQRFIIESILIILQIQ